MAKSPFNKKLEKRCEYCVYGSTLNFDDQIICKKRGVTDKDDNCHSYKYDPLKRTPSKAKALDFSKYEEYDYSL